MRKKNVCCCLVIIFFSICAGSVSYCQTISKANGLKTDSSSVRKQSGFYNVTSLDLVTFTGQFLPGIQTICGYRMNKYLSIGGGIGYEMYKSISTYDIFTADLSLLPVFLDIRFTAPAGNLEPVVALNLGYKVLLNKPSTQSKIDSVLSNALLVESKDIYTSYNTYTTGGLFLTAEIGVKAHITKKIALYLSVDYSLWSNSGTYYLSDKAYLLNSSNEWVPAGSSKSSEKSLAYVDAFTVRFGIIF